MGNIVKIDHVFPSSIHLPVDQYSCSVVEGHHLQQRSNRRDMLEGPAKPELTGHSERVGGVK